jgi:hypothetical protein
MTKDELIEFVTGDITVSGSLNVNVKSEEIGRIIDAEKKFWWKNSRDAVELKFTVIKPAAFRTEEFKKSRTIQLPECVYGIDDLREIKDGSRLFGISDPDLNLNRVMLSDLFLSPFMGDAITSRTISYSWYDLTRSFTLYDIQFDFNWNTHRLKIIGHNPVSPVLIRAYVAIDEADLYEDYYFQRWVIAKCKTQLHRILKTFETTTVGNISITTMYGDQGKEEIEDIKKWLNDQEQPDYFVMFS